LICQVPLQPFPALPSSALGAQPSFEQCGLSTLSHIDPYVVTDAGDLQLTFGKARPVRVTSQLSLLLSAESPAKDCTEYILQQGSTDAALTFMLKMPQPGMYKVLVSYSNSNSDDNVCGAVIVAVHCRCESSKVRSDKDAVWLSALV